MALETTLQDRTISGIQSLLLAPVFLLFEITAVLLPGILFWLLMLLKHNQTLSPLFEIRALGYRTKLAAALVICYFTGKILSIPFVTLEARILANFGKLLAQNNTASIASLLKSVAAGVFIISGMVGRTRSLDYLMIARSECCFTTTTGIVFLLSSTIPGDHALRFMEAAIGIFLIWKGYVQLKAFPPLVSTMIGVSLTDTIEKLSPQGLAGMLPLAFSMLAGKQPSPAPPAVQTAANSPAKPDQGPTQSQSR